MSKSHTAGWASDAPTPAQMKELFAQIDSGRVTKERLQSFLRNDAQPIVEVKGRAEFRAFLNKELGTLGLSHWYGGGDEYSCYHYIGVPRRGNWLLNKIFKGEEVAKILAQPDPDPGVEAESGAFRIRVLNAEMRPKLLRLAEAFRNAGFGLPVEVID